MDRDGMQISVKINEDQSGSTNAVFVNRDSNCFTGIVFGLPLSIISWVGIFYLVSATQKMIF